MTIVILSDMTHASDAMGSAYATDTVGDAFPTVEAAKAWCEQDFQHRSPGEAFGTWQTKSRGGQFADCRFIGYTVRDLVVRAEERHD